MPAVVIVDTGCANISSVYFALKRLGCEAEISRDANTIRNAGRVILPGVGTAHNAMQRLQQAGLVAVLQELQQPVLGICLGMQLLNAFSEEGNADCLSLIPDRVCAMSADGVRLPHMGWNTLHTLVQHPLLQGFTTDDYVYFVHSFAVKPGDYTLAQCHYGQDFAAIIGKDNVAGAQFHPERSGKSGARLLQNFLEWQL